MKILAIIPARSGSKGLKDKNIKPLCGKPLCAYTIETAIKSGIFSEIHFSTDSEKYAEIAKQYGAAVPFLRDAELATDGASTWDVVKAVVRRYQSMGQEFDAVMILQPTTPFRTPEDILNALQLLNEKNANAIIGVTEPDHSPFWCAELPPDGNMYVYHEKLKYLVARQKLPKQHIINGAIYLVKTEYLFQVQNNDYYQDRCFAYFMPPERSVDIDNQQDFDICEALLRKKEQSSL